MRDALHRSAASAQPDTPLLALRTRERARSCMIVLDRLRDCDPTNALPPAAERSQAFTLHLRSADFDRHRRAAEAIIARLLEENPFTTLQVVLEPTADPQRLSPATLESLLAICFRNPTYLDRFYSVLPGRPKGAKRLIIALKEILPTQIDPNWIEQIEELAAIYHSDDERLVVSCAAAKPRRNSDLGASEADESCSASV